ncbi:MAG TPA: SMI1/KNR4 family protein, partial [Arthrobacter sp.]|nr:SMI1/KNR4 family protein [Arthrobacter sp.]
FDVIQILNPDALRPLKSLSLPDEPILGNKRLPPSYETFMRRFGYGRLFGLLIVFPAENACPDSLAKQGEKVRGFILEALAEEYLEFEPDGSESMARSLYPFAMSENGEYFAWDTGSAENGEYPIYCIGSRMAGITYAASDMYELVNVLGSEQVKSVMGSGYAPLPATFDPL